MVTKKTALILVTFIAFGLQASESTEFATLKQQAKAGHAESMWLLAGHCHNHKDFKRWVKWRNRFIIRVLQDAACSTDKSTIAALDVVKMENMSMKNEDRQALQELYPNEQDRLQQALKYLAWIEKNFATLPEPYWIARYGMETSFMGKEVKSLFVSLSECQKKRKEVIEQFRKEWSLK